MNRLPSFLNEASYARRISSIALKTVLVVILAILAVKSAVEFRHTDHDYLSYHLPLALRMVGLTTYLPRHDIWGVLAGYPPLAHFVMGSLVWFTGNVNFSSSLNAFGLLLTAGIFWHLGWGKKHWVWLLASATAIPLFLIHLPTGYIDLWTACGVVIMMASLLAMKETPLKGGNYFIVGTTWALFSKVSTWPASALYFLLFTSVIAFDLFRLKLSRRTRWALTVSAILAFGFWPCRNLYYFGNPSFPYQPPAGETLLSHLPQNQFWREKQYQWSLGSLERDAVPMQLQGRPRYVQFLSSAFEVSRWQTPVPMKWTEDQGTHGLHFRQGGWFFLTWSLLLLFTVITTFKTRALSRAVGFTALSTTLVVAVSPQSLELRYWLFLPLTFAVYICFHLDELGPVLKTTYQGLILGCAIYVLIVTQRGNLGIHPSHAADWAPTEAQTFWQSCSRTERKLVCADDPFMFYWSGPTFNECAVKGCYIRCGDACNVDVRKNDVKTIEAGFPTKRLTEDQLHELGWD